MEQQELYRLAKASIERQEIEGLLSSILIRDNQEELE